MMARLPKPFLQVQVPALKGTGVSVQCLIENTAFAAVSVCIILSDEVSEHRGSAGFRIESAF